MAFRLRSRQDAGRRDRFIAIEQIDPDAATADPTSGEPVASWIALVGPLPAARQDVQGYERQRVTRPAAANEVRWEINYRADMDPERIDVATTRRIVYEGRIYNIVAASQIGRQRGIELWTVASTALDEEVA